MMKRRLQQWLPFLIGGVILVWYLSRVDWLDMWQALQQVNYWWIFPILLFVWLSMVFRALRWKIFLHTVKRIRLYTIYNVTLIGFMLNLILPGRVGELIKPYLLKRREGVPFSAALGTCFTERVYDLTAVIIILAFSLLAFPINEPLLVSFPTKLQQVRTLPARLAAGAGTVQQQNLFLNKGQLTVGRGEQAITGEIREASGTLTNAGLQLSTAIVAFPTGTLRLADTTLSLTEQGEGPAGTLTGLRGTGTSTPVESIKRLDVQQFVHQGSRMAAVACLVMVLAILFMAFARDLCVRLAQFFFGTFGRVIHRLTGRDTSNLQGKIVGMVDKFAGALAIFKRPLPFLVTLVYTALVWISIMLTEYLLFVSFGLGEEVGIPGSFLLMSILALSVAAPQLPGFLGVFQVACIVTLAILGIEATGVRDAYANLLWLVQVLPIVLLGFISLRLEGMSFAQVRSIERTAEQDLDEDDTSHNS